MFVHVIMEFRVARVHALRDNSAHTHMHALQSQMGGHIHRGIGSCQHGLVLGIRTFRY